MGMAVRLWIGLMISVLGFTVVQAQQTENTTYTTEDGTFTFEYPGDWFVEVINPQYGANAHIAMTNLPQDEILSDEAFMLQLGLPKRPYELGLPNVSSPSEAVQQYLSLYSTQSSSAIEIITPSSTTPQPLTPKSDDPDVIEFESEFVSGAYGYARSQIGAVDASSLMIVVDVGNDYWVWMSANSLSGGLETLEQNEQAILDIALSMRYTPPPPVYSNSPDLPLVYSGLVGIWQRGTIQFFYPEDWVVSDGIILLLSNTSENLGMNAVPQAGQVIMVIQGVSETRASVDQTELYNTCGTSTSEWTAREMVSELLGRLTPAQMEQMTQAGITITQPESITINDVEIVYFRQYQGEFEILTMFVDLGNGDVPSVSATTLRGEMTQFEDTLFEIASTFIYTPLPCETENDG
jgi:hypothetical protein